ncbi:hypothetical protein CC86DRAFT_297738 [Ophiobolus disseminans]|uniref:Zn(2)-C6 fungal-type domain-containing protein n=1 Tax=Ophiobolus disseminans TaxID=1469910 RepID=A0A6A6ZR90_9PLEO|nr:hypothetical protein CC86DRAFT_297738 [Ophiobolus disseminans]
MTSRSVPFTARSGSGKPTPKERGCFQCSRRRIICDKAEPSCGKCIKKGIECSGANRIRFTDGVARRGLLKDCKIPDIRDGAESRLPNTTVFPVLQWPENRTRELKRKEMEEKGVIAIKSPTSKCTMSFPVPSSAEGLDYNMQLSASTDTPNCSVQLLSNQINPTDSGDDEEEIFRADNTALQHTFIYTNIQPWLAPVDAGTRMLFSYFSDAIAPVMVVLDTASNGYREVILPMAFENDVLRRTVCVVAAQHLSRHAPNVRDAAEDSRAMVISHLRKHSDSATQDQVFNHFTWATIIVLLVGETVTGSPTCSHLLRMLLCLAENSRTRNENSTITRFLETQTNMFELLGLPLSGETSGIPAIHKSFQTWQNWLMYEKYEAESINARIFDQVRQCFDDACTIYIRRATSSSSFSPSPQANTDSHYNTAQSRTISDLISRLSSIPPHTHGAHALVWPCFVAGAEAEDPAQRAFFVAYMNAIYARTGFRNIPVAVQGLERVWRRGGGRRWTEWLPEVLGVLVM